MGTKVGFLNRPGDLKRPFPAEPMRMWPIDNGGLIDAPAQGGSGLVSRNFGQRCRR
jgi:hypothetical protein